MYSGVYTLDVIIGNNAYECIVVVGTSPQQTIINQITEINTQSTNVVKIFEKGKTTPTPTPTPTPGEEPSICYFEPNNEECNPDSQGNCPDGFGHNDDNQCIPHGPCPSGYGRIDDDETGTCYPDDEIVDCDNGAKVLDEDDCRFYDPNPPQDPREVCFFEPNDELCNPNEDGSCNEGFHHNDDEQCVPDGACPEGYGRLDDDETGKCYATHAIKTCPNGAKVLQSQVCPASEAFPNEPVSNDTSSEEEEPPTCEEGFVLENGRCAALDSNCGGVPCTASEKEDSTTSDPIPGEPHTPTESEETVEEIEEQEEQDAEEQEQEQESEPETEAEDEQPEQQ